MTPHTVTSQWWDHATLWNADDPTLQDAGHTTDGGRVFGITRVRYDECDHYGCKPVAVIAIEDRGAVERLHELLGWPYSSEKPLVAALRQFANPTPPKPEEPMGLGAVVEDENGALHVRTFSQFVGKAWLGCVNDDGGDLTRRWADIKAVRVLSPGYTEDAS